jgi:hypothetical protein
MRFFRKNSDMCSIPRLASNEAVVDIVRTWVEVLEKGDYAKIADDLGYSFSGKMPAELCVRNAFDRYRSPDFFPGVEKFHVTNWRTATGGNPKPQCAVTWYRPHSAELEKGRLAGAVAFDLPLNGIWSDLTADFVFFETAEASKGYLLRLEEIGSAAQTQREMQALDEADDSSTTTFP